MSKEYITCEYCKTKMDYLPCEYQFCPYCQNVMKNEKPNNEDFEKFINQSKIIHGKDC